MKHTLLLILLLACAALPHLVKAQGINASPTGDACPRKTYTYTLGAACGTYKWTVAGGTITRGQGTSSIDVLWNDVPTNTSTTPYSTNVQVAVSSCTGSVTTVPTYPVFVSSISDKTPGPLTVNGTAQGASYSLPFGDNATLTLKVPAVELPQSNSQAVKLYALAYDWVIPSGWRYNDGTNIVSDGSSVHRVNLSGTTQPGNQVSVTPAPGTGGLISVRAVNNNCVNSPSGPDNSLSQTLSVNVVRPTPTLTIISDKTPSGGPFSLICGDQSDYHFRVVTGAVPAGGSFSNLAFQVGTPLVATGPLTGSYSVATQFSGATSTTGAGITFSATYTRNGASTSTGAPGVTIKVQPLPKPTISGLPSSAPGKFPPICQPTTLTASGTGANSYSWSVSDNLILSATTGSSVTVSPSSSSSSGTGSISVTASNTNAPTGTCQTSSDAYNVNVNYNPASGTYTSSSNSTPTALNESYQFAQLNQTYYILMDQNYTFDFKTVGPNNTPSGITIHPTGPRTAYFTFANASSVQIVATATGSNIPCGQTSISSIFLAPFNFAMSPNPASSELTVTDNSLTDNSLTDDSQPATKSHYAFKNTDKTPISIPLHAFDATLYDMHGKLVKSQTKVLGKTVLNVSDLPAGLYNLRVSSGKYIHSEHVQITH